RAAADAALAAPQADAERPAHPGVPRGSGLRADRHRPLRLRLRVAGVPQPAGDRHPQRDPRGEGRAREDRPRLRVDECGLEIEGWKKADRHTGRYRSRRVHQSPISNLQSEFAMYRAYGLLQPGSDFTLDGAEARLRARFPGYGIARAGD